MLCFTGVLVALTILLNVAGRYLVNYGICKVDVNEGERPLKVQGGQSLLAALIGNRIYIPSACGGKGSCGYCKVTVLEGGGPLLPTETPFLTPTEAKTGVRLACQVKIRNDVAIRIPADLLNVRQFQARLASEATLTPDIKEINLALLEPAEIAQRPGQYIQVQVQGSDGPVFRAYSISSAAHERNKVQLVVRLVPGGIASTYLHGLKPDDPVVFTGPYGEFRLSEDPEVEVVCVGGGCGMAPIANIVTTLYERWPQRRCWMFFGCRTKKDVFYLERFREMERKFPGLKVVYALSDALAAGEDWDGETGFVHLSVDKALQHPARRQAFLCGPPPMIDAVTEVLKTKGLLPGDIFYDKF
jgi:Na+-transporting NADH:ubiquinone oxidoreductase subunit F